MTESDELKNAQSKIIQLLENMRTIELKLNEQATKQHAQSATEKDRLISNLQKENSALKAYIKATQSSDAAHGELKINPQRQEQKTYTEEPKKLEEAHCGLVASHSGPLQAQPQKVVNTIDFINKTSAFDRPCDSSSDGCEEKEPKLEPKLEEQEPSFVNIDPKTQALIKKLTDEEITNAKEKEQCEQEDLEFIKRLQAEEELEAKKLRIQHDESSAKTFCCSICNKSFMKDNTPSFVKPFCLSTCDNIFHENCLVSHLDTQIKEKKLPLICPVATCGKEIEANDTKEILSLTKMTEMLNKPAPRKRQMKADKKEEILLKKMDKNEEILLKKKTKQAKINWPPAAKEEKTDKSEDKHISLRTRAAALKK